MTLESTGGTLWCSCVKHAIMPWMWSSGCLLQLCIRWEYKGFVPNYFAAGCSLPPACIFDWLCILSRWTLVDEFSKLFWAKMSALRYGWDLHSTKTLPSIIATPMHNTHKKVHWWLEAAGLEEVFARQVQDWGTCLLKAPWTGCSWIVGVRRTHP